jgi:hypothetical protein
VGATFGFNVAVNAGRDLVNGYLGGDFDEVFVVYSEFIGMAKQVPVNKQLLPIPPIEKPEEETDADAPYLAEHICEPSTDELLGVLLPKSIYVQIFSALLETSTSEHAARMMAMDNATKACNDMFENLTAGVQQSPAGSHYCRFDGYCRRRRGPQRIKYRLDSQEVFRWERTLVKSRRSWGLSSTLSLSRASCRPFLPR